MTNVNRQASRDKLKTAATPANQVQVIDVSSIGQRIHELRTERSPRLTQQELAERAGLSIDLIQKLEQGRKATARITSLMAIAEALDVDLGALVGRPTRLENPAPQGGILALRRALTPVSEDADPPTSLDIEGQLAQAWRCYWTGSYDRATALLPSLISAARAAGAVNPLADAHRCAASVLVHLGHDDLALLAISRAIDIVEHPLLRAAIQGTRAWVLLNQARPEEAAQVAVAEADHNEPSRRAPTEDVVIWGGLLVTAATAHARAGDNEQAQDLIRVAHGAAIRLGEPSNHFNTAFGEAQVIMQSVDVAVVSGDYTAALDLAERMPAGLPGLPLAARARHATDVAASHTALGHTQAAEQLLIDVERMAPKWMRYQVFPRAVVSELLHGKRPSSKIRTLAERLGVAA